MDINQTVDRKEGTMETVDEILEHHGVKGMKWGVRKDRGHEGERTKTRKIAKLDKKFENQNSVKVWVQLHNRAAEMANTHDIDRINNKPQYKGKDFTHDSPLRRQYYNEHQQSYMKRLRTAAEEMGTNASGTKRITINSDKHGNWEPILTDVKHADQSLGIIRVIYDSTGHIVKLVPEAGSMQQTADVGRDFLVHYGVLGMKWGVRKDAVAKSSPSGGRFNAVKKHIKKEIAERTSTEVTVRTKPGSMVRVVGGTKRLPHDDAIAARVSEQIAKKNTLDSLSNKDLQHLVNRMNLEAQYRNLAVRETRKSQGEKMVEDFLASPKADVVIGKAFGPHAAIGKQIVNGVFKRATNNKAMNGGLVSDKKDKKK